VIDKEINALAKAVAKKAASDATSLEEATEALKALASWHAILLKYKQKKDDNEDEEPNFGDFAKQIEEVANGGSAPKVRGRRRAGPDPGH
jgi:hypothetical protein